MSKPVVPTYDGSEMSWDHFDHWATHHSVEWSMVRKKANHAGLSEVDTLRALAVALLRSNRTMFAELLGGGDLTSKVTIPKQ